MQEFKKLLKNKLAENEMTINELARRLKVSDTYIRRVIAGGIISRPLILKIVDYFRDPNLLYIYEKELQKKRKSKKSKKSKKEVQS